MLFLKKHTSLDDDRLVGMVARGDQKAFRTLVERHQHTVLDFAYRFLGDVQEARDVAQETMLRVYRHAGNYTAGGTFRAWVLRIARNQCLDRVRRPFPVLLDELPEQADSETPQAVAMRNEDARALALAVHELPEAQRTALVLRHNEGLRYAEIAEAMDLSVGAVESLLVRARKGLRRSMDRQP